MVRRKGHSRRSYAWLRLKKYRLKWTRDTIPLQLKLLIKPMRAKISIILTVFDFIEIKVFGALGRLGIPTEQWPFYIAHAKRLAHIYSYYTAATRDKERQILYDEGILRGLDPAALLEVHQAVRWALGEYLAGWNGAADSRYRSGAIEDPARMAFAHMNAAGITEPLRMVFAHINASSLEDPPRMAFSHMNAGCVKL